MKELNVKVENISANPYLTDVGDKIHYSLVLTGRTSDTESLAELCALTTTNKEVSVSFGAPVKESVEDRCMELPVPKFGGAFYNEDDKLVYIERVIYKDPATIVFWSDGTKTTSKCDERDTYNEEMGLAVAVMKKLVSSEFTVKLLEDWAPTGFNVVTLSDVRKKYKD